MSEPGSVGATPVGGAGPRAAQAGPAAAGVVRLSIAAGGQRLDLSAPADTTVAELAATALADLGRSTADRAVSDGGWGLQRLGGAPLSGAATLAEAKLLDGELLHLRARADALPQLAYDDLLDAVASGVAAGRRWAPQHTGAALLGTAAVAALSAQAGLLAAGPSWLAPAALLAVLAAVLLGSAGLLARQPPLAGLRRQAGAVTAGLLGVLAAAGAGAAALGGHDAVLGFGAVQLLPAAGGAILAAAVAALVTGTGSALFVGVGVAGAFAALGAGFVDIAATSAPKAAALVAGVALLASPALPRAAFGLARLALPPIPVDADDLRQDATPVDGLVVLERAARADRHLTGLVAGAAAALAGCAGLLAASDVTGQLLAGVLAVVLLLRARLYGGAAQRAALLCAGSAAALAAALGALAASGVSPIVALGVPAAVLAVGALATSARLPGARLAPPWGRAADLLEGALVVAVLPLVLAVLGAYGAMRDLTS